ncbi:MAG: hypothetical protein IKT45_04675 [Lachnospiraceae bacterium]|nr:hypothetical protein [Lachnospiraceae bacterium]
MKNKTIRLFGLLCSLILLASASVSAYAALPSEEKVSPHASAYLTAYTAWAVRSSSDQVYVYYDVTGAGTVGCLGAKLIVIEMKDGSKWTPVKTYTGTTSNGMLFLNNNGHGGNIVYQGTSGTQYRAIVTIFGGSSTTNGDSRIVTTNTV